MKNFKKGFTLIELLVVVAVIGVLAAIILASLNNARGKGDDAGVKSALTSARAQGEIFYNINTVAPNSYTNVCTNAGAIGGALPVGPQIFSAADAAGLSNYTQDSAQNGSAPFLAICNDGTGLNWAAEVPLKTTVPAANQFWCVDSSGKSEQTTGTSLSASNDVTCQ